MNNAIIALNKCSIFPHSQLFSLQTLTQTSDDDKNQQRLSQSGAQKKHKNYFSIFAFSLTTKRKSRCRNQSGVSCESECVRNYIYM